MNVCMCGAQDNYPHAADCPWPLFRASEAQRAMWEADRAKRRAYLRLCADCGSPLGDGYAEYEDGRICLACDAKANEHLMRL